MDRHMRVDMTGTGPRRGLSLAQLPVCELWPATGAEPSRRGLSTAQLPVCELWPATVAEPCRG